MTLIEVIVVMAIIGILAVAASIPILSTRSIKLDGAASKLKFDVRYAQQLAINRHTSCGVSFNVSGNNYFVYIGNTSVKATDPLSRGSLMVNYSNSPYSGVALTSTTFGDLVSFNYTGTPYDSTNTPLAVQGNINLQNGSDTVAVTIQPNTGEVKL